MGFLRNLIEGSQTQQEERILKMAEEVITLSDFDSSMYIAYNGTPFVPINENWTSKQIMEELGKLRQNYINVKKKELC